MQDCIFCKIASGEVDAKIIGENDRAICFMDLDPITKGHCLVIPKKHYQDIFDIDKNDFNEVMDLARDMATKLETKLDADGLNILNSNKKDAQQAVFHLHIHLIPRYNGDKVNIFPSQRFEDEGLDEVYEQIISK